jgi:pimeloyl-ACP methyl ester carboxylesterase
VPWRSRGIAETAPSETAGDYDAITYLRGNGPGGAGRSCSAVMSTALSRFAAATVKWADVGGTRVAYRRFGRGPALVFVHGWPFSGVTFRALVDRLCEHYTCWVLDLPGAGDTPWDPSIEEFFADLGALVGNFADAVGLERYGLVGFDSGGTIARIAAARSPGRVTALLLTNTEVPDHDLPLVRWFQRLGRLPLAASVLSLALRSKAYRRSGFGFGGCFGDRSLIEGEFLDAVVRPLQRDPGGPMAALRTADLDVVFRLADIHADIDAPMLCVWGDRDPFFPLEGASAMVDGWRGPAHLDVVSGARLLVHEEAPDRVASAMHEFFLAHAADRTSRAIGA